MEEQENSQTSTQTSFPSNNTHRDTTSIIPAIHLITVWRRSCDGVNVYQGRTCATPVFTCGDTTPCSQAEFVGFYQCIGGYQWSIISIIIDLLHNHSYHLFCGVVVVYRFILFPKTISSPPKKGRFLLWPRLAM